MDLHVGCPIWAYKGWVGSFYPEETKPSDFLQVYAQQLNTVEGNTTFYAVPAQATLQRWVEQTPPDFRFCPKLPRAISHSGNLMQHLTEARQFFTTMSQLGSRLGPFFLQLPPTYSPSMIEDLREFLASWPPQAQLAVEVRHPAWFAAPHLEVLQKMLASHQMAPDLPIVSEPTAPFTFLRYIGHPLIEHNVTYLEEWSEKLAVWLQGGLDTYVFCHCPDERVDPLLCRELHHRVSARASITPLPQMTPDSQTTQPRLF